MARRTAAEKAPSAESPVQSPTSQEAPSSRDPSPLPPPPPQKAVRTRLKIDKQVELLEICTRWIGHYSPDKNGGKAFWDKVHEVFESAGSKYSADSCKTYVQGRMHVWDQGAPIEEELEEPLRAWILAVDGRKIEEKEQKIDEEKAKKEKADKRKEEKEKADKEKADRKKAIKERAEKEKADKEKAAKGSGSKKPVASKTPDHEEDLTEIGDISIPSIESDLPKYKLSDITRVGELPVKKQRTRSFVHEGGPAKFTRQTRATSLQAGPTQRKPSVPPGLGAKPTVAIPPSSTTGEKRKRPAPKASVDDAPGPSARPKKKVKTTNDFLEQQMEGHLIRFEESIGGKFEELKKELGGLRSDITNLNEWHVQLNEAINNERGIVVKGSTDEVSKASEVVVNSTAESEVTDQSPERDESKSTNESDAEMIEDAVQTTQSAGLKTIEEVTETSILREEEDAPTAESSGDEALSTSSDEDENVPTPTSSTKPAWSARNCME